MTPQTTTRDGREALRCDLAATIDREPADLPDTAVLRADLGLDSLAMLSLLTWLEEHGVSVDVDSNRLVSVGDVLTLAATAAPRVSIRINHGPDGRPSSATSVTATAGRPADPLAPVLEGRTFRLAPVRSEDMNFLYALAARPETCFRWRYRGAPPPPDRFAADLWKQVLAQFVARRTGDDRPGGHVVAYSADLSLRHVYVGAVFAPEYAGTGVAAQAVEMFVRYLFHTFPLHKIYLEIPGFNWPQMRSGAGRLLTVEGVLRGHHFYAGRTWDEYLCAIYRDGPPPGDPA